MDEFFQYGSQENMLWFDDDLQALLLNQSAFVPYSDRSFDGFQATGCGSGSSHHRNVNKRMIEFLRTKRMPPVLEAERERGYRHMISERMRREKQKQSYLSLHSVLPTGTKSDKKSIVEMAAKNVEELQRYKEELDRRKNELDAVLDVRGGKEVEEAQIKLRVAYPSSGINSMLEVLKCLKNNGVKTKAIQSKFSAQEFTALLDIQTMNDAADVERAVHRTLLEVEKNFRYHFQEG